MIDQDVEKLEKESMIGERYRQTWNEFVDPFFVRKKKELYEAFIGTSSEDVDRLVSIRMHVSALDGLEAEFAHFINTGRMASQQLAKEEDTNE